MFLLCSVPEQSHGMLMLQEGGVAPFSSLGEHGQTVGDINKSHKADPPQVGVALSDEPKKNLVGSAI